VMDRNYFGASSPATVLRCESGLTGDDVRQREPAWMEKNND